MIASTDSFEPSSQDQLPNSKRVYVNGTIHPGVRVGFREISQTPTKSLSGDVEDNAPVRVYDTSGPWGDPDFDGDVGKGLPALRDKWIRDRADVEEYDGRTAKPLDNGYLSSVHADHAAPSLRRPSGHPVLVRETRHHHSRDGAHRHPRKHGCS